MSKILKNNTASPVTITDTGITVPASGQYTIFPAEYLLFAASDNVITLIADLAVNPTTSTLTVNDGSSDLSISDGTDLIKGIFPKKIQIRDHLNENDAKVNSDEELHVTTRIRGGTDETPIGNDGDALKVSGLVFEGTSIQIVPREDFQAFLNLQNCLMKELIREVKKMNIHLSNISDYEDVEVEPEDSYYKGDF